MEADWWGEEECLLHMSSSFHPDVVQIHEQECRFGSWGDAQILFELQGSVLCRRRCFGNCDKDGVLSNFLLGRIAIAEKLYLLGFGP